MRANVVLCLLILPFSGCLLDVPADVAVVPPLRFGDEQLTYVASPLLPEGIPLSRHVTLAAEGDELIVSLHLEYEGHPEMDSRQVAVLNAQGKVTRSHWDCGPLYPIKMNAEVGCLEALAGEKYDDDAAGVLFGVPLLSGKSVIDEIVEVPISYGGIDTIARFSVVAQDDGLMISAADPHTMDIPHPVNYPNEPLSECSIFTGEVLVDARSGWPLRCEVVADDEGDTWTWTAEAPAGGPYQFAARPSSAAPSNLTGLRYGLPADGDLPFQFSEAIAFLRNESQQAQEFLEAGEWLVLRATMAPHTSALNCNFGVCTGEWTLIWQFTLLSEQTELAAKVTKTWQATPRQAQLDVLAVEPGVRSVPWPTSSVASIPSLEFFMRAAERETGYQPEGISLFQSQIGRQADWFVSTQFSCREDEGCPFVSPFLRFRSDGTLFMDMASMAGPLDFPRPGGPPAACLLCRAADSIV